MKKYIFLLLTGLIVIVGGCVPFGIAVNNAFNSNPVFNKAITINEKFTSSPILVNPDFNILASLKLHLSSTEIKHNNESNNKEYDAKYRFPIELVIRDSSNKILYEYKDKLDWNSGSRSYERNDVNARSGEVIVEFDLEKFALSNSDHITVSVLLTEDNFYYAKLHSASLIIYDNVHSHTTNIITGIAMIIVGLIIFIIGIVLLIINYTKTTNTNDFSHKGADTMNQLNPDNNNLEKSSITTSAMLCHLSTFAGFIIPFGGILGPLIMWQIKKDDDPFINRHGIAALNFHLSMAIYYFVSFLLAFVVIGFLFLMILAITDLILTIIACIKASNAEEYQYPLAISFIKMPEQ